MARRRRGHLEAAHESRERWLLTYADLITLLMVFFVVMYSLSRADVTKFARLQGSLQRAFRVEVLRGNDSASLHGDDGSTVPVSIIQETVVQAVTSPDNHLVSTVEQLRNELLRLPQTERVRQNVYLGPSRDGVVISLAGNVLFDSGKADLKPDGLALLDTLAARLRELPNDVRIEGHTDDTPISTPLYPSNWELSAARATSVARYLVEQGGLGPVRLIAAGYGEHRPVAPNETREGRARNRRVDVVVLFPNAAASRTNPAPSTQEVGR